MNSIRRTMPGLFSTRIRGLNSSARTSNKYPVQRCSLRRIQPAACLTVVSVCSPKKICATNRNSPCRIGHSEREQCVHHSPTVRTVKRWVSGRPYICGCWPSIAHTTEENERGDDKMKRGAAKLHPHRTPFAAIPSTTCPSPTATGGELHVVSGIRLNLLLILACWLLQADSNGCATASERQSFDEIGRSRD